MRAIKSYPLGNPENPKALILAIFTICAFFIARNDDTLGGFFLLGMALLSLFNPRLSKLRPKFVGGVEAFALIFGLAFLSASFDIWGLGNLQWAFDAAWKFLLCILVVSTFATERNQENRFFPRVACISCIGLATLMILQNTGFELKRILSMYAVPVVDFAWNEKFHSFWLLFLLWLAVSQTWRNDPKSKALTGVLLVYSFVAIMTSYSESAKLAFVTALVFFLASMKVPKFAFRACVFSLVAYLLFFPFVWQLFPSGKWTWIAERHWDRIALFEIASNAICGKWFLGYGFGSTLSLQIGEFMPQGDLFAEKINNQAHANNGMFPGYHPHNIVALIWLDFGLIGVLLLALSIRKFYRFLLPIMNGSLLSSCIMGLFVSAIVTFSFSFSIWQTDVILTYAMFFGCLVSLVSQCQRQMIEPGKQPEQ
jgi:O-antigen ligase